MSIPFHLALPVHNLNKAHNFYTKAFNAKVGRSAERWIDFDFFGHQLSLHLQEESSQESGTNKVDGDSIPVRHFGVILPWGQWHELKDHLLKTKEIEIRWIVQPKVRFKGEVGEQATMFILDPSNNAIEFKSFQNPDQIFAH
ncbi:MAG: glyoxalase [Proteobacteria bacterium]|nr:glyoxalase [Pseudomonadota bacterium]